MKSTRQFKLKIWKRPKLRVMLFRCSNKGRKLLNYVTVPQPHRSSLINFELTSISNRSHVMVDYSRPNILRIRSAYLNKLVNYYFSLSRVFFKFNYSLFYSIRSTPNYPLNYPLTLNLVSNSPYSRNLLYTNLSKYL